MWYQILTFPALSTRFDLSSIQDGFQGKQRPPQESFPEGLATSGQDLVRSTRCQEKKTQCSSSQGGSCWCQVGELTRALDQHYQVDSRTFVFPTRPTSLLRPAVRCQTVRYNRRIRAGRGFTSAELAAAGIRRKEALSIGIPYDHRRRNKSEEGVSVNVERLQAYKERLIIFPKNAKMPGKGDSTVRRRY